MISVVIPTYNAETNIANCINSLLMQNPGEIIIVDGNSQDKTKEICLSYKNPLIRFITNTQSHKTGSNRNLGVKSSKYDYIVFIDSDCVAHKDLIKTYNEEFKHNNCITGNVIVNNPGKIPNFAHLQEKLLVDRNIDDNYVKNTFFWIMNSGFKKDLIVDFPNASCGEDMVFISDMFKSGHKIKFCKELIVYHNYPETLLEYFNKKINLNKVFIKEKSSMTKVNPKSQYGLILKLLEWDLKDVKSMIQEGKICFNPFDGYSVNSKPNPKFLIQNMLCLVTAVAVLECKGGSLDTSYKDLLENYSNVK